MEDRRCQRCKVKQVLQAPDRQAEAWRLNAGEHQGRQDGCVTCRDATPPVLPAVRPQQVCQIVYGVQLLQRIRPHVLLVSLDCETRGTAAAAGRQVRLVIAALNRFKAHALICPDQQAQIQPRDVQTPTGMPVCQAGAGYSNADQCQDPFYVQNGSLGCTAVSIKTALPSWRQHSLTASASRYAFTASAGRPCSSSRPARPFSEASRRRCRALHR